MDFTFTEEQETISKLARDVLERRATPERLASTCWALRCRSRWAATVVVSSSSACCWPK
jgi:hypothetical protein